MVEQATSAPYSLDVLDSHDDGLVFAKEFGTNVTGNLGDAFQTTGGISIPANAAIDARLGMLEVQSFVPDIQTFAEPRGRTFVTPDWATYPTSPLVEDEGSLIVIFAHVIYRFDQNVGTLANNFVDLVLGPLALVGNAPTIPFATCSIQSGGDMGANNRQESNVVTAEWLNGPAGPSVEMIGDNWGGDVYWRLIAVGGVGKETEVFSVSVSRSGLNWVDLGQLEVGGSDEMRRIGLAVRGLAWGALDWVRIYTYVAVDQDNTIFIPAPPKTGGRLFIR